MRAGPLVLALELTALVALVTGCGRFGFDAAAEIGGDGALDQGAPSTDADLSSLLVGCTLGLAMDEPSWAGGVVDRCAGHHDGTATGGAAPVDDPERGRVGELVGGASCVIVPDAPELRGGGALTASAWVRPTQLAPGSFGVVSKRVNFGANTAYSVFLWTANNGSGTVNHLYVDIDAEDDRFEDPGDEFLDTWRQITVVFDGSQPTAQRVAIYVDGAFRTHAPETSSTIGVPALPPDVYVGCLPLGGPAQSLVGRIDDVMLWSRALPAAEVAAWYQATR